ncbi:MAG: hypothetical protein K2Q14_04745 [Gammaproteobacteria bacterium]|nr:hypothetical protein [Gammaproteobacteria bacterium]MBY0544840.1 hypothetical protein [Gammaproteobacteria bacterium]
MKTMKLIGCCIALLITNQTILADNSEMNATLERVNQLLNQVNPLVNLAQSQEDENVRVKFQFDALRHDIAHIQEGIAQAINRVSIQPRTVEPLIGDYLLVPDTVLPKDSAMPDEDDRP